MALTDAEIIAALMASPTNAAAAAALGISESHMYSRMRSEAFQKAFSDAKATVFKSCLEQAQRSVTKALETIVGIMTDEDYSAQVRLNAAQALLTAATRLQSSAEKERQERASLWIL